MVFSLQVDFVVFVDVALLTIIAPNLHFLAHITHRSLDLPNLIVILPNNRLHRFSVTFEFFILRQQFFV